MTAYSGFHFQRPVNDWPRAAAQLPAGTWIKYIDNVQALDEAKRVNPGLKTVLRHFDGGWQQFEFANHTERRAHARLFLRSFVDATFMNYAHNVDAIEELNEYNAMSHTNADVQKRVDWVRAVSEEWDILKRSDSRLSHIRLVVGNVAIGNDLPLEAARIVQQYGNIAGYHPYVPTRDGQIRPDEWRWYSGRWTEMDARFRAAGITVEWLMTEAGPIGYTGDHLGPNDGWRHPDVCNGNLAQLLAVCKYWMDRTAEWNYTHDVRVLGQVLYNSGGASNEWRLFEIAQPEMDAIAIFNRDYTPPPPPVIAPPPPPDNIPLPSRIIDVADTLPMNTESADWPYETRPLSAIDKVIIHHSVGQPTNPPESIAIGHVNRGWPGIGYHFYINVDSNGNARIYKTNHLTTHSYHAGAINRESIGICLAGDFTSVHPSPAQLEAARFLIAWINDTLGEKALMKHRDFMATACPGATWEAWWSQLTEEPVDEPVERRYGKEAHLIKQGLSRRLRIAVMDEAAKNMQSVFWSADDWALTLQSSLATVTSRRLHAWNIDEILGLPEPDARRAIEDWVGLYYPDPPPEFVYHRIRSLFTAHTWRSPVGTAAERESGQLWPGSWIDATGYLTRYQLGSGYAIHTGSDLNLNAPVFDMDRNKPVYAAASGKVTYAGVPSHGWQGVVIIRHQDAAGAVVAYTRYAHLQPDEIVVRAEDWVKVGERIGLTGRNMVGSTAGPFHLHFDVSTTNVLLNDPGHWPGDNRAVVETHYVDPKLWIQARL